MDQSLKKRIARSTIEKDLLRRALGKKKGLQILDATAGLCRDSLRMAYWGNEVWACEREPKLAQALAEAFEEARSDKFYAEWIGRLHLVRQSTETFLTHWKGAPFDVIAIDPMFPSEGRSSLPQKDLQFLQDLVGKEDNAEELLQICWSFAPKKILLKRPLKAPELGPRKATHTYRGRAHRWDVYVNP